MAVETRSIQATEVTVPEKADDQSYEPLLPVEVKLIVSSLVLGVVLLAILVWVSNAFFRV